MLSVALHAPTLLVTRQQARSVMVRQLTYSETQHCHAIVVTTYKLQPMKPTYTGPAILVCLVNVRIFSLYLTKCEKLENYRESSEPTDGLYEKGRITYRRNHIISRT